MDVFIMRRRLVTAAIVLAAFIAVPLAMASQHDVHCGSNHLCIAHVAHTSCVTRHDPWHCRIWHRWLAEQKIQAHASDVAKFHEFHELVPLPAPSPSTSGGPWQTAIVSEYGTTDGLMGATTADGSQVTTTSLGVANLSLDFGTRIEFCDAGCVVAVVDDRGPYVAGRLFDLQPAVAQAIGFTAGVGPVRWRIL